MRYLFILFGALVKRNAYINISVSVDRICNKLKEESAMAGPSSLSMFQGTVAYYLLLDNRCSVSSGYLGAEFHKSMVGVLYYTGHKFLLSDFNQVFVHKRLSDDQ